MFILKKTGSETNISVQSIKDAVKNNDLIAQVNRKLNYKIKNTQSYANNNFMFQVKEFIDDITQEELNKGLEAVKEFLANDGELLKEYFAMFKEVSTQEASLKYAKEFKKDEIDKARDLVIEGGVSYKDKIFQSAVKDRNLLTSTVSLFAITKQVPEGFVWIAKDNTAIPFTLEELIELGSIMANSVNTNTIKARNLKDKIEQAKTLEELESIVWSD